jgi:hypothetical protein
MRRSGELIGKLRVRFCGLFFNGLPVNRWWLGLTGLSEAELAISEGSIFTVPFEKRTKFF